MSTIEDFAILAEEQSKLGQSINQLFDNFKKERVDRRTTENTLQYQRSLEDKTSKFNKIHQELEGLKVLQPDHDYFKRNYNKQVQSIISDFSEKIEQRLNDIPPETQRKEQLASTGREEIGGKIRLYLATINSLTRLSDSISSKFDEPHSRAYFSCNLNSVNEYWLQINSLYRELILDTVNTENIQMQYQLAEDKYHYLSIKLQERLDEPQVSNNCNLNVKLPKIILPTFDGTYTKWKSFMDLFVQVIHNQPLSSAEKMYYLKAHLSGEPNRLIRHLQATEQNYEVAWKILVDRYDNLRSMVTAILHELLSQNALTTESSAGIKRIHDITKECLLSLQNLGIKVEEWNSILLHILLQKLDKESRRLYEQSLKSPRELQRVDEFFQFLESRFQMLEAIHTKDDRKRPATFMSAAPSVQCPVCQSDHKIYYCTKFLKSSPSNRLQLVKQLQLCPNCLKSGHKLQGCTSQTCKQCKGRHNTLLHNPQREKQEVGKLSQTPEQKIGTLQSATCASSSNHEPRKGNLSLKAVSRSQILLATAVVNAISSDGRVVPCRVLLDSASQLHFIRESFAQFLNLKRHKVSVSVTGIGGNETLAKHETRLVIQSRATDFKTTITAIVLPKISDSQPATYIDASHWEVPTNIKLADPEFYQPQAIDMLIGAELYYELLESGKIRLPNDLLLLQNTCLGWIVAGKTLDAPTNKFNCHIVTQPSIATLEKQLSQFWELDHHDATSNRMTEEEHECEQLFQTTFQRSTRGQFIVQLPFREPPENLGSSIERATKQFYSLERKLERNPNLKEQYHAFMEEFEKLGHMEIIPNELIPANNYYLPHHCVIKPESSSTKLRVVFNGSEKTTSGKSLNNILMVGPTVQSDLFCILIRFRMHKYVITTDICKMYRQILVDPTQRRYQLILWRKNNQQPIKTYQLNTVTYGTASAPFLATRCLNQLALLESDNFPLATEALQKDTYVDDILTGTDSIEETVKLKNELIALLSTGCFELKKFCSNSPKVLNGLPEDFKEKLLQFQGDEVIKTLGMIWQPKEDVFQFTATHQEQPKVTKRTVLSAVTKIFDPLGLVGPVTVLGKLFVQDLWRSNISWDEELPERMKKSWQVFERQLTELNHLRIPRYVSITNPVEFQLHAFADSSEAAYGACCYIRTVDDFGQIRNQLLCAKSRLAPLKTTTLARLELCAAVLMVELVERVRQCLPKRLSKIYYYTDSTIVLSWLSSPSYSWSTFVANRVEKIQQLTSRHQWHHVDGTLNPADIISRGMLPANLNQSTLWFKGPKFLFEPASKWPKQNFTPPKDVPEARDRKLAFSAQLKPDKYIDIITNVKHNNSFLKLQRIFAYCIRFATNCKLPKERRTMGQILITELDVALNGLIRNVQRVTFFKEYQRLKENNAIDINSSIQSLSPYLDNTTNIIRVGGRLRNSQLNTEAKNQALLPRNHILSELLLRHLHQKHMHAAPQTLIAIARQNFWILEVRMLARQIVHRCVRCFRCKPKTYTQIMADLPAKRVTPARPFHTTGVDFCGPIIIHHKMRRMIPDKAYIAVFVCFSTKAVHLEVVSNLSATAFINALKRFISRRGLCSTIYCDNATNFVGARSELKELETLFKSQELTESIQDLCSQNRIDWKPIPPRSPHFGGLWEAAVKSAKRHLIRQAGSANLTYEELNTIITQIEAILNSRPLTPMSSDPNDLEALTPGHFLIGAPMTAFAEPDVTSQNANSLDKFRRLQHIQQSFWKRWSSEYLQELQLRRKWKTTQLDAKEGTLVLLKDSNSPPLKWCLGRIIDTFKGPDEHIRVVTVKTASGIFKRAIHNLCPLPIEGSTDNSQEESAIEDCKQVPRTAVSLVASQLLSQTKKTRITGHYTDANSLVKRRRLDIIKGANHPLKGRFFPINSRWLTASNQVPEPNEQIKGATTEETRKGTQSPKSIKVSRGSLALSILLLTSFILPIFGDSLKEPVEVTSFTSNPGLFFESLGQAQIITSEWNIIAYFNLKTYWDEFQGIKMCIREIEHLCNATNLRKHHCTEIYHQFQTQLQQLEETNKILYQRSGSQRMLSKRSPLNIIGTVANKLFGILDAEYANYIEGQIKKTETNENYMMQLLKNQTSILESTTNIMKGREESIQQQFDSIKAHIHTLHGYLNDVQYEQQHAQTINSLAILTNLVLQNYQKIQNALLNMLTDLHHNKINPLLISPKQLQDQLTLIKEHLPSTLTIPGSRRDGSLFLYNLMTAAARVTKSSVIIDIRIPLQQDEYFQLFKLIPIPTLHENRFILIEPFTEYLIVSLPRDRYYPLSQSELDKCQKIEDEHYLCPQNHPIYNLKSNVSQCEMDLLNHRQTLSKMCRLRTTRLSKIWMQLNTPNNWLFSMDTENTVNIVCGTQVFIKTLIGSGVLKLHPECLIKQNTMTINGHGRYQSKLTSAFVPRINISSLLKDHLFSTKNSSPLEINELHLQSNGQELEELTAKIKTLKSATTLPNQLNSHDVHHYAMTYILITAALVIFGYIIYWRCKQTKTVQLKGPSSTHSEPPVPKRRLEKENKFVLEPNSRREDVYA